MVQILLSEPQTHKPCTQPLKLWKKQNGTCMLVLRSKTVRTGRLNLSAARAVAAAIGADRLILAPKAPPTRFTVTCTSGKG